MAAQRELSILLSLKDQASKELGNFSSKIKSLQPNFQKMAVAGTTAIGLLTAAIGSSISKAADMEDVEIAFTTMLRSAEAAKNMVAELNSFAAKTPYEFQEIANASKSLLAFAVPAKSMQDELRKIGDIASGIGAPIGEIAELYGKAKVQGRLFGEDINQLTGRGIPIIQELAKQFGITEGEVKKMVESGKVNFSHLSKAFDSLTSDGGQFFDMMQNKSEGTKGMFSSLKDTVSQTMATIGAQFIPMLKELMTTITPILVGIGAWTAANPELTKYILLTLVAVSLFIAAIGTIGLILPSIIAGFTYLGVAVGAISLPIALVTAAIIAIVGVVVWWVKNWQENVATMKWLWQGFADFFIGLWTNVKQYFSDVWSGIKIIFNEAIDSMTAKIQPLIDMINRVVAGTQSIGSTVINGVKGGMSSLGKAIGVNDAIISPNGNIISTHPDDYLIATKDPHSLANGNGGVNIVIYGDVSGTELIEKVKKALTLDIKRQVRI